MNKIKKILDFNPKINFNNGINLFSKWVTSQKFNSNNYDQSIIELKNRGLLK
jgi:dTDP-L-rhamnose 4-epimerase